MRLSKKKINQAIEEQIYRVFYQVIADIHSLSEAKIFLEEILTKTELEALVKRLAVAQLLKKGQSYEKIKKTIKVSSATVASIAEQLKKGKGFKIALKKISAEEWAEHWAKKIRGMMGKKS